MPRIKFTTDPKLPRDIAHLGYRKGVEVDLSADLCERWIRRGAAVYVPETIEAPSAPALPVAGAAGETFDPETADADALRAFLTERGEAPHPRAGEGKLREIARALLAAG
jgi:hypothetical protein